MVAGIGLFGVACTQVLGVEAGTTAPQGDAGAVSPTSEDGGTCRANLRIDPENCGRCGRSCFGTRCVDRRCIAAEVGPIPSDRPSTARLLARGETLFFALRDRDAGVTTPTRVVEVLSGGTFRDVGAPVIGPFALSASALFRWSCVATSPTQRACSVVRRTVRDGAETMLPGPTVLTPRTTGAGDPLEIAAPSVTAKADDAAGRVFVSELPPPVAPDDTPTGVYEVGDEGRVQRTSFDVSEPVAVAGGLVGTVRNEGGQSLVLVKTDGCAEAACVRRMATVGVRGGSSATPRGVLFWSDVTSSIRLGIIPVDGRGPQELGVVLTPETFPPAPPAAPVAIFVGPAGFVYSELSTIYVVDPSGGPKTRLMEASAPVDDVAQVGDVVYWIAEGTLWKVSR